MFKINDQLYCVLEARKNANNIITITKVGRKWLELSNGYRCNIETLKLDGGKYTSPGQCYLSKEIYEDKLRLSRTWCTLRTKILNQHGCPKNMTIEKIEQILEILESPNN